MPASLGNISVALAETNPSKPAGEDSEPAAPSILAAGDLQHLFSALKARGYRLFGPNVSDGVIQYAEIASVTELPIGWTDLQDKGKYRLTRRDDDSYFGYNVGPHSWKNISHPPVARLWHTTRNAGKVEVEKPESSFSIHDDTPLPEKRAFIGVRSCEIHAIEIQDKVFLGGEYVDPQYKARRAETFIVAVNCSVAGANCFCASMGTGPKADRGFDLALTEVIENKGQDNERHYFVVEPGSEAGLQVLDELPKQAASIEEISAAEAVSADVERHMGRHMETEGLKELLYANANSPQWEEIAQRCLTCGNCTMVCPTCFCTTVEDVTDLAGVEAERVRKWDSCFTLGFSYIHGGSVRVSSASRYRQWMTHKLASWQDQFGTSGCVGCGRCITWCPVGIDITEEVGLMRTQDQAQQTIEAK